MQVIIAHQTELAAALMASFHDCFRSDRLPKAFHQISNQITQPIKLTAAKVATIPR
jgi:hypothetical protein